MQYIKEKIIYPNFYINLLLSIFLSHVFYKISYIDRIYDEFQYPILAMIIYFSLQLPYLNKILLKYLPSMFTKDHELKFTGYLFKTITFGLLFYGSIYFTRYLSELE